MKESKKCVIYCRVSSVKQADQGHGLDGQEQACRAWALREGYTVVKVFREMGVSGGIFDRPQLQLMFQYLRANKDIELVLFEDVSRIARSMEVHIQIANFFIKSGIQYQTVSQPIEQTPVGKFIENSLANFSELHKNLNRQNVINKMKARLEKGYWSFGAVPGYQMVKEAEHGKIMRRSEPKASIIIQALEGFASGQFPNQVAIRKFLKSSNYQKSHVSLETVKRLLKRSLLYAGYIEYPRWGIATRKGHHDALISFKTHQRILERLGVTTRTHERKDQNPDYPARGFVVCSACCHPLTASKSRGRNQWYPYYRCNMKGCRLKNKSIPREDVEGGISKLLQQVKPQAGTLKLGKLVLEDLWKNKTAILEQQAANTQKEADAISTKIKRLIHRISQTSSEAVITSYEREIEELEKKRSAISGDLEDFDLSSHQLGTAWKEALPYLKNPQERWQLGGFEEKRLVLKLVFSRQIPYDKDLGFGTADLSLPIEIFSGKYRSKKQVVDMVGVEPTCEMHKPNPLRV